MSHAGAEAVDQSLRRWYYVCNVIDTGVCEWLALRGAPQHSFVI
jgi:hypothetical protein